MSKTNKTADLNRHLKLGPCSHATRTVALLIALLASFSGFSADETTGQSASQSTTAQVYFISPSDGDTIEGDVHVVMGLRGMGVAPAGTDRSNTGHHHLIINSPTPSAGIPIPSDENHRHFGGGQTEAVLSLPKGSHTLQLVIGDFAHRPHAQPVASEVIRITVK